MCSISWLLFISLPQTNSLLPWRLFFYTINLLTRLQNPKKSSPYNIWKSNNCLRSIPFCELTGILWVCTCSLFTLSLYLNHIKKILAIKEDLYHLIKNVIRKIKVHIVVYVKTHLSKELYTSKLESWNIFPARSFYSFTSEFKSQTTTPRGTVNQKLRHSTAHLVGK